MHADAQSGRTRLDRDESRARIIAAATALIRERGFAQLSVGEIMEQAEIGRTLFYRHFDDLGDLLLKASREAIEALYATEVDLSAAAAGPTPQLARDAIAPAVAVYRRHGPLLRALAEAANTDERIGSGQEAIRDRFDSLVTDVLARLPGYASLPREEAAEIARALNLLNTAYLLDAFGSKPRITEQQALETLSAIWTAVIERGLREPTG